MIAKALIFILAGAIIAIAGTDRLPDIPGLIRYRPPLGWMFLLAGLAIAGGPPLSGFAGKVLVLAGGIEREHYLPAGIALASSLLVLYSIVKVFIRSFWGETLLGEGEERATGKDALLPGAILAALVVALGLGAERVLEYVDAAVETLLNPALYIDAVLHSRAAGGGDGP